jgi:oxygen-independent coproporphyrinogen-3 oxidase
VTAAGIYIHIPFCRSKCGYCHFLSFPFDGGDEADAGAGERYADALLREMRLFAAARRGEPLLVDSIYLGGGTPSLVPARWIADLLDGCRRLFVLAGDCETTLEANPGTVSSDKAAAYRQAGVNRVSLGAQSFSDAELRAVGRIHDVAAVAEAMDALGRRGGGAGFEDVSLDLMLGLPGQTAGSWRETLARATDLPVRHLSVYMLDLDDDSPLRAPQAGGAPTLPDDDLVADLYAETVGDLAARGFAQYEISNFAKGGRSSRHNLKYWRREPVYGFGLGSHSFDGRRRYANVCDFGEYFRRVEAGRSPVAWSDEVTGRRAAEELFFLGLRLAEGVRLRGIPEAAESLLEERRAALEDFCDAGLLDWTGERLRLTRRGMLLSNEVLQLFV